MLEFDYQNSINVELENCSNIIRQYLTLKRKNTDCVVFFRLGEFYETYFEDAILISKECEIALTKRDIGHNNGSIPMAGVPYSSSGIYIKKLLDRNYKVAIAEQGENTDKKGLLDRKIVRKYTSGTILDDDFLNSADNNYIAALFEENGIYGLSYCDLMVGEFKLTVGSFSEIKSELFKISPSEVLVPLKARDIKPFSVIEDAQTTIPFELISTFNSTIVPLKYFSNIILKPENPEFKLGYKCANAILNYVFETQKDFAPKLDKICEYQISDYLILDEIARKNLELIKNVVDFKKYGSLFWVLDCTKTPMGSRLLKNWINQPLIDVSKITNRQNAIKELFDKQILTVEIEKILDNCYDISRLSSKISNGTISPKDFLALKETLFSISALEKTSKHFKSPILNFISPETLALFEFAQMLNDTISNEPNPSPKEGYVIKDGANAELDFLRGAIKQNEDWFREYEQELKIQTGAKKLRVAFNKLFGYFIEVPMVQIKLVPKDFKRKQTLSASERFYTDILMEHEQQNSYLKSKAVEVEFDLYTKLCDYSKELAGPIREFAANLAQLDVIFALYKTAKNNNYTCPIINANSNFKICKGRHSSIEKVVGNFTPNDIEFSKTASNFKLLTGPNMAGKSTYMRQNAIIAVLAQIGSFVPAENAELSIVDKIFVRIASGDNLINKNSTFMVEMLEIAHILRHCTKKSLILLDEVGKGTSTLDGVAIARSVGEYIIEEVGAKTIFATHFHELKIFSQNYPAKVENLMANFVKNNGIDEPKRVISKGFADKSYGIDVAIAAKLPNEIISRAKKYLNAMG